MEAKLFNRFLIILITSIIMLITLMDIDLGVVRIPVALTMVLILPGYTITTAIFLNHTLGFIEKLMFTLGFSLGVTALGGLFLNLTYWGLQPISWVLLYTSVIMASSVITIVRLYTAEKVDTSITQVRFTLQDVLLIVMAGVTLLGSLLIAFASSSYITSDPYTELWMLWADESQTSINIGIQNRENMQMDYALVLRTKHDLIELWEEIELESDQKWEMLYTIDDRFQEADFVQLTLYRTWPQKEKYREVHLQRYLTETQ